MRLLIFAGFFLLFSGLTFGQKNITGRVTDGKSTLSNVQIANLTSGSKTTSDAEGQYQMMAEPRQELQYTYMGMDTVTIMVEDVTRILNVKMNPKVEELDEVTVSKTILKGQKEMKLQYDSNPNIVKSAFGFIDKEASAFSMRILDEEELNQEPNLSWAIQGQFAGVKSYCSPKGELIVSMRGPQSINSPRKAVFDVDGMVLSRVDCYQFVGNIKRMAFIPSLKATSLYGTIGLGGVVIINTKTGTITPRENNKPYDRAKLRNNFVEEGGVTENVTDQTLPNYSKQLRQSNSLAEAKTIYSNNRATYGNHPHFLLDSYAYFYKERGEESYANEIMERLVQVTDKNPVMLKALAYTLESENRYEKAHEIYKKVYTLRPDYAQSFIDVANSYRNLGQPKSATTLYARHAYLQDEGMLPIDSMELGTIMKREMQNLFTLENSTLKIKNRKKAKDDGFSTRLVFEWNDSEAEFDLQFVNPGNQYFNWKHTLAEMPERIQSEKRLGYSMADFLLDDELQGNWKVNATYHGNKQLTPSYLKVTIYRNYGSKLQSKDIKVYRLGTKGANQHLFDFYLPSRVAKSK
ncbi:MAG: carboxypeptidase-like regulatory domain-containing protein [Allomuricauda sp.]|jgi:tetratricopeptide (TPR) repeat protein